MWYAMSHDNKRQLRKLKRDLKRSGSRRARRQLKRELVERPEEASHSELDFGRLRSAGLNAMDQDATRRRTDRNERGD
jgi:hypothetical protein